MRIKKNIAAVLAIILLFYPLQMMTVSANGLPDFNTVFTNNFLSLYYNSKTAEIAVGNIKDKNIYYSNPQDEDLSELGRMKSQVVIEYYNENNQPNTVDSYTQAVLNKQFTMQKIENGIQVNYKFGKQKVTIADIPEIISKKRMESKVFKLLSKENIETIKDRYTLIEKSKLSKAQIQEMENKYPRLKIEDLYIRRVMPQYIVEEIYEIFKKSSYSLEDLKYDNNQNKIKIEVKNQLSIDISVEYVIEDENLLVKVDSDKIKISNGFKLSEIRVLEFFGAQNSQQKGYIFVPDGSGSIINFNNRKLVSQKYHQKIYGEDQSITEPNMPLNTYNALLPIYGMSFEKGGLFAIAENDESVGSITADISKNANDYNYAHFSINATPYDTVFLGGSAEQKTLVFQNAITKFNFVSRYFFMDRNSNTYSDMANIYRNYLIEKGILKKNANLNRYALNLNLIGTAQVENNFLGFKWNSRKATTDFNMAMDILKQIKQEGINEIDINYSDSLVMTKKNVNFEKALSSGKQYNQFLDYINSNQINCYFDFEMLKASKLSKSDLAIGLNKNTVKLYGYNIVNRYFKPENILAMLLSPTKVLEFSNMYFTGLKKQNILAVNIKDASHELYSDFSAKKPYSRISLKNDIMKALGNTNENNVKISVDKPNIFTIDKAQKLNSLPCGDSSFDICDYSVPFYQMVIHSYKEYSSEAINIQSDFKSMILKSIESGSELQFTWLYKKYKNMKTDEYNFMFYKDSIQFAVDEYKKAKIVADKVKDSVMVKHTVLKDGLVEIIYENKTKIVINYNENDEQYVGKIIKSMDYLVA